VYHKHRATSSRFFSPSEIETLVTRNQLLFLWINIRDWKFLISHGIYLPWNLYRMMRDHGIIAAKGLIQAALQFPSAMADKLRFPYRRTRADAEVFELLSKPGLYFWKRKSLHSHAVGPDGSKPRLLWLTAYLPHTGRHAGAGRMFQLLKRLSADYRITLLSFLETDDETKFLPEVESLCENVIAMRRSRRRRWHIFAYEPFDEFRTPEMQQALDRCLEESDFDLIQLEYTQMACYADRSRGIPTILTKHEVDFAACARRATKEPGPAGKARWFYNYLQVLDREVKLTRDVDAAVCMTDPDARELKRYCPSLPTHVINTGVDLDYFKPPELPAEGSRLVFVGAFQHLPNVEAMIYFCREVLPRVRNETPCSELYIVGSNPAPAILALSTIPGVHVTGFVPDIRPYMAASSVYVVPLRLGVGIRGKILEAWSMAMAVVSTPVGSAGLRCEHGQNILIADSAVEMAAQIVMLLSNPELRQRLGAEGRKTAEQFYGWERSAGLLDALYRRYLSRPDTLEKSHAPAAQKWTNVRPGIPAALESRPHAYVE
jgi:glycosyltransferase involved in cell wall biosynthesis